VALQLSYGRKDGQLNVFPGDDFILSTPVKKTTWLWWLIPIAVLMIFLIYRYRKNKQVEKSAKKP
jgi:cytochrome c-type biogenesis protein CcmH/NrfF